ncbi:hypothetical protein J6590_081122 [Homalodisca vitripennis]|nr:hypothetical protein J6590_081122 [Homalodisca vitripennis]
MGVLAVLVSRFQETGEVGGKKPSVTLNLATNGLKVTTINGRAGGLLPRTVSLSGHPSKQQPCSTMLDPERCAAVTRLPLVALVQVRV